MYSIGCDIEEISRFKNAPKPLLDKLFTEREQAYCLAKPFPERHLAVRFCAKEATVKALHQAGAAGLYYKDIEIVKNGNLPEIHLDGFLAKVSLSHSSSSAMAVVVLLPKI